MKQKHTPGPWGLAFYNKGFMPPIDCENHKTIAVMAVGMESHGDVAYMHHSLWGDDEAQANAMLIAAAPDLLSLLRETLRPGAYGLGSNLAQRIAETIALIDGDAQSA